MSPFDDAEKSHTSDLQSEDQLAPNKVFEEFCADREIIEAWGISDAELQALSRTSLLGTLTCKEDVLFILRQIRDSMMPAETEPSIPDAMEMTERIRIAAFANLLELDSLHATRRITVWQRIKLMLGFADHSASYYRTR